MSARFRVFYSHIETSLHQSSTAHITPFWNSSSVNLETLGITVSPFLDCAYSSTSCLLYSVMNSLFFNTASKHSFYDKSYWNFIFFCIIFMLSFFFCIRIMFWLKLFYSFSNILQFCKKFSLSSFFTVLALQIKLAVIIVGSIKRNCLVLNKISWSCFNLKPHCLDIDWWTKYCCIAL